MARLNPVQFTAKNGKNITLRSPEVGEGEKLITAVRRIMETSDHLLTMPDEFNVTAEQEDELILKHLNHPDKIWIVPESEGQILGMLSFSVGPRRRNSHTGEFGASLLPEFRGLGIGTELLRSFLAWARANPRVEKIKLRVHAKNEPALKLYKNSGFYEEGREIKGAKLGEGHYDDVILMACFV